MSHLLSSALLLGLAFNGPVSAAPAAAEAAAKADAHRVDLSRCEAKQVPSPPLVPTHAERLAAMRQRHAGEASEGAGPQAAASPYQGKGLTYPVGGGDGRALTYGGQTYSWHLSVPVRILSNGTELRSGLFRKPDGSLWFGTISEKPEIRPGPDPLDHIPNPCGLQRLTRTPWVRSTKAEGVTRVGEMAGGKLKGFGVREARGKVQIGFFMADRLEGWGVSSTPLRLPRKGGGTVSTRRVQVGAWSRGQIQRGYSMMDEPVSGRIDIWKLDENHLYAGQFGAGKPHGFGVNSTTTNFFRGRFHNGAPASGRVWLRNSSMPFEWYWPQKYAGLPVQKKGYLALQAGDVLKLPRSPIPLVVVEPSVEGMVAWLDHGILRDTESFQVLGGPQAEKLGQARLAAFRQTKEYARQTKQRADKAAAKQRQKQAQAAARQQLANQAQPRPRAAGSYQYQSLSSPSSSNYETRRSASVMRQREYQRQLNRDINRIGKRY